VYLFEFVLVPGDKFQRHEKIIKEKGVERKFSAPAL
jgi:hypothetical protein